MKPCIPVTHYYRTVQDFLILASFPGPILIYTLHNIYYSTIVCLISSISNEINKFQIWIFKHYLVLSLY